MIQARLDQLQTVLHASLKGAAVQFRGISTDTRKDCSGSLFVAIKGEHFDAHNYLQQAKQQGAAAALVQEIADLDLPQLLVEDSIKALGQIARWWALQNPAKRIAITGSNGKTSTKEMTAAILRQQAETLLTEGNLNNHIGVPLTLLRLAPDQAFAVIEMGANHAGEIEYLTQITRPHVALINNAAEAHLEGFGSLEGVRRAKGELYEQLEPEQTAVFNADDPACGQWQALHQGPSLRFSLAQHAEAEVYGEWQAESDGLRLRWSYQQQQGEAQIAAFGEHNARNALAAVAIAYALEIPTSRIIQGLQSFAAVSGRLQVLPGRHGSRLFNDSYNANPASLKAGVAMLVQQPGRAWLALGDMAELGAEARQWHAEAGQSLKQVGVERLFAIGDLSRAAVESFGSGAQHFDSIKALSAVLEQELAADVNLLIKGSRSAGMERLVAQIQRAEVSHAV